MPKAGTANGPEAGPEVGPAGGPEAGPASGPEAGTTAESSAPVHIVGGGLAGCEAAWQIAAAGVPVILHEMRPTRSTAAHQGAGLAELVCSNSFRSDDYENNAVGVLHEEMRRCGSLIMRCGDAARVPAGSALAVDRDDFSARISAALEAHPLITIRREEIAGLPPVEWDNVILATGPLTSPALAEAIAGETGDGALAFFDAIAPIIHRDSIDFKVAWFQSRYDRSAGTGAKGAAAGTEGAEAEAKGEGGGAGTAGAGAGPKDGADYINCPLNQAQYEGFIAGLLAADYVEFRDWEQDTPYFEGCMPIEVMAARGVETLRFGPMKPVGLTDPHTGARPHAVVQLRQDNALGTLYNMVGFQTKMRHGAQTELLRMIPGLERAEFARLGGLHRNTFINAPKLLDPLLRLKSCPRLRFAGQITGVEGYVESAAIGLLAGRFAAAERRGHAPRTPPPTSALGALIAHISGGADATDFQPMNINFGLFPPLPLTVSAKGKQRHLKGRARKQAMAARALTDIALWSGPL